MSIKRFSGHLNTFGDTIVEVMIVLAILGLAISISYATANRSLLNARQAQENSEASLYVQSQIEALRYLAPVGQVTTCTPDPTNIYSYCSQSFCVPNLLAASPITPYSTIPAPNCTFGSNNLYTVQIYDCDHITTDPCDPSLSMVGSNTFVVQATWPDIMGQGDDHVTQAYRVHPGS
ncbi:MAG TPA: type II secretion system protein [Candidatus Saccharimonadales bacterium]|jgi:type II secretory pathway pseudopilin PulG|nr:type II secretion system protein [Candidatus Saccharimonadales bacterium]